ncbi:hypothetical protein [Thiobacillus sp.]
MHTRFRRFLLLLMMLALPVQTFASASMLGCALSHQAAAEPMAMAGEMMQGCHESEQPDAPPAQHDCKHCAVCALASTLPVPASETPVVTPVTQGYTSHPAALFSGFVPDGPERPPRPTLA